MTTTNQVANTDLPEILQGLTRTPSSGSLIALSLGCKRYQYILANYGFLKAVQNYTFELREYVRAKDGHDDAPRDHDLTTARVCQRKSEMITAILDLHKVKRVGSPAWLRGQLQAKQDRINELERENIELQVRVSALTVGN